MKNWVFLLYTKHGITIIFRPPIQNSTFIDYSFLFRSYILMKITKSLKELENFFLKKCVWRHLEAQPFLLLLCVLRVHPLFVIFGQSQGRSQFLWSLIWSRLLGKMWSCSISWCEKVIRSVIFNQFFFDHFVKHKFSKIFMIYLIIWTINIF